MRLRIGCELIECPPSRPEQAQRSSGNTDALSHFYAGTALRLFLPTINSPPRGKAEFLVEDTKTIYLSPPCRGNTNQFRVSSMLEPPRVTSQIELQCLVYDNRMRLPTKVSSNMKIIPCPKCRMRVVMDQHGACPSCGHGNTNDSISASSSPTSSPPSRPQRESGSTTNRHPSEGRWKLW